MTALGCLIERGIVLLRQRQADRCTLAGQRGVLRLASAECFSEVGDNTRLMKSSALRPQPHQATTGQSMCDSEADLVVSVISHGHAAMVQRLLHQMAQGGVGPLRRVVLTLNLPEPEPAPPATGWPFVLDLRRNQHPQGFGANHNAALEGATEAFVCVLNPDVELLGDAFAALVAVASHNAGDGGFTLSYPVQVDALGHVQGSERALPSPGALFLRRALGRVETRVDWVNAACMVLPLAAWRQVRGFDESYHMYCEDVDLCLRLRLAGGRLVRAPVRVLHVGERASNRNWRHLWWHVSSLLRLWRSPVYRRARHLVTVAGADARTIAGS